LQAPFLLELNFHPIDTAIARLEILYIDRRIKVKVSFISSLVTIFASHMSHCIFTQSATNHFSGFSIVNLSLVLL